MVHKVGRCRPRQVGLGHLVNAATHQRHQVVGQCCQLAVTVAVQGFARHRHQFRNTRIAARQTHPRITFARGFGHGIPRRGLGALRQRLGQRTGHVLRLGQQVQTVHANTCGQHAPHNLGGHVHLRHQVAGLQCQLEGRIQILATARFLLHGQHATGQTTIGKKGILRSLILQVNFLLALAGAVQRRLSNVQVPASNQVRHVAVKERQQQRTDMRPVNVRVGHDDNLVVAQLVQAKILTANPRPQRLNQGADFLVLQHAVKAYLFHVQDLPA